MHSCVLLQHQSSNSLSQSCVKKLRLVASNATCYCLVTYDEIVTDAKELLSERFMNIENFLINEALEALSIKLENNVLNFGGVL